METKILEQLASLVLPKEILERFVIVKIDLTSSLFCAIIWRRMKINELRRING